MNQEQEIYVLSVSGGRSSGMMGEEWLKDEPKRSQTVVIFCNTGLEDEATLVFVQRLTERWREVYGVDMLWLEYDETPEGPKTFRRVDFGTAARKGEPFARMLEDYKGLPNLVARNCTAELKVRTIKRCLLDLGVAHWTNLIGIRYDEPRRLAKLRGATEKQRYDTEAPLAKWKVSKADVLAYWKAMPFDLEIENEAFGNCNLCFLKGKGKKLHVLRKRPEIAEFWLYWERQKEGYTFNSRYSVAQLMAQIKASPMMFGDDPEPDIECFCNTD